MTVSLMESALCLRRGFFAHFQVHTASPFNLIDLALSLPIHRNMPLAYFMLDNNDKHSSALWSIRQMELRKLPTPLRRRW